MSEEQRPYKIIRRIGRFVFNGYHVYPCKSIYEAKQKFKTLANLQNHKRLRYSWRKINDNL